MNLSASSAKPGDPTYFLEGIIHDKSEMADFEGPLSLILLLLSKNKIEIRDIKISDILDQYLEYLNAMEKLDLEIASEFVQMASYLLYIKTRMLLTEEKEVTELEQLIASLEQLKCKDTYAAVKTVTPMLEAAQCALRSVREPQRDRGDLFVRARAVQSRPPDALGAKRRVCRKLHGRHDGRYSGIHC